MKKKKKNIVLIGYRCTGKTSVGKKISARLKMPFYDTDDLVKKETGRSVADIVAEKGWPFFRARERAVIAGISDLQGGIIATGGGAVLDQENVSLLKRNGVFVWLKAGVEVIAARMAGSEGLDRPPLSECDAGGEIAHVLRERLPVYERLADFSLDTSGIDMDQVAGAVCEWFGHFEHDAGDGVSMIAFCGIECTACPAYIATRNKDPEGREKIARRWSLDFKLKLTSEDVLCDGCLLVGKRLCSHCMVCKIRKCGIKKKVKNCAYCGEFPCGELRSFWEAVPDARARLEAIRRHVRREPKKARG